MDDFNIHFLAGATLAAVTPDGNDSIDFKAEDGRSFRMYHSQDCCETVKVESVVGDLLGQQRHRLRS